MDRETESLSKQDKFHLKKNRIQKSMYQFLELYQDFVWKYQTVYCLYVAESTARCKAKNVSAKSHDVLLMKRFI